MFQKENQWMAISCLFCIENESVCYLLFHCCVASCLWKEINDIFNLNLGHDLESVARFWVSNKKNSVKNMVSAATMWCI
jgi:hypothetical protein